MKARTLSIGLTLAVCSTLALAQKSEMDATFVQKASQGGMAEVKLGQLAQERASNQAVKDFGSHMVADHTKAGDELKSVAMQQGMTVATSISGKDQALYDRLSKLSGAEFDKAYMDAMVDDHKEDIAEFQKEASSGQNAAIKNFASQTLPTLKMHLSMAQQAQAKVNGRG